jgi:hypothetical protein
MCSAATAQARDAACSLVRAAGTYGVSDSGTVIGIGPRAAVGSITFDAAGNANGSVTASLNGGVSSTTLSGTYTVNSDCTGSSTFGEYDQSGNLILTATVALMFDDNMRETRFLFTSVTLANGNSLATAINGDARKLVP